MQSIGVVRRYSYDIGSSLRIVAGASFSLIFMFIFFLLIVFSRNFALELLQTKVLDLLTRGFDRRSVK
jgi:hypothetical protein